MSKQNKQAAKRAARESWMWQHSERGTRIGRHKHSQHVFPFNKESLPSTDASVAYVARHRRSH